MLNKQKLSYNSLIVLMSASFRLQIAGFLDWIYY